MVPFTLTASSGRAPEHGGRGAAGAHGASHRAHGSGASAAGGEAARSSVGPWYDMTIELTILSMGVSINGGAPKWMVFVRQNPPKIDLGVPRVPLFYNMMR